MASPEFTTEIIAGVHLMAPVTASRSIENPNLSLNDPAVWESVFSDSLTTATGESMTAEKSLSVAAVWQAVNLISGDVAKMPLMLYREAASGVREEVKRHPLVDLTQYQPNEDENAFKFWRRVMVHALVWNNAYVWAPYNRANGYVEGLYHLLPDRTIMRHVDDRLYCVSEIDGVKRYFPAAEVLHIEGISHDCLTGADIVRAARNSWALALAQEKFASKFFKHGGRVGGILELPAGMQKPARDTVEEGFRKSYEGADNPFRTIVLRDSAKFHAAQQSPADAQLVDANEQQVRQVARWFNLSPSKLGLSDSVSYNSKSEDNQAYLDTTLSHWLKQIAQEATLKLLSPGQRRELWFDYDTSELLRMNPLQRAQYYQTLIAAKVINPNEARRAENLQPYAGGEKFENPNTNTNAGGADGQDHDEGDDEPEEPPATPNRSALRRVVYHLGSNARFKAERPNAFIEWLDGGLVSHRHEARALGVDPAVVDRVAAGLKEIAGRATADQLAGEVDQFMGTLEEESHAT